MANSRAKILTLFLLFFYVLASGQQTLVFTYSPRLIQAQQLISQYKLEQAKYILVSEKKLHPENTAIDYLSNYIDFYTYIGSQDARMLDSFAIQKNNRINRLKQVKNSPFNRFTQAEIHIQWAFCQILQGDHTQSALSVRSAYKLLEDNQNLYPDFTLNKKSTGMLHALLGTIPDNLQWIVNLVGMNGNYLNGMHQMTSFLAMAANEPDQLLERQCGTYYYLFLLMHFGDKKKAWSFCQTHTADYETNLMSVYLRSYTAIKTGHSDEAIVALKHRPFGKEYATFPILDYLHGVALLNQLNENASLYLKKYVSLSKGKNYIKDAYRRLVWLAYLQNHTEDLAIYRNLALTYGAKVTDEDKSAYRECNTAASLNPVLLRARLLYDGGQLEESLKLLKQSDPEDFQNPDLKTEFYYRMARNHHDLNQLPQAIVYYKKTIEVGKATTLYYPPMSCLQLGLIYESLGHKENAAYWYKRVPAYRNYDYKNGISQKAKAGLIRVKA